MSNYIVDGADLTGVANAIRTKGGTSAQITFPQGFVDAVQAIETGITPIGTKQISISENGVTIEDVADYASAQITVAVPATGWTLDDINNRVYTVPDDVIISGTKICKAVFAGRSNIKTISGPNVTDVLEPTGAGAAGALQSCSGLISVSFPKISSLYGARYDQLFQWCSSLKNVDLRNLNGGGIGTSVFNGCTKLEGVVFPKLNSNLYATVFQNCSALKYVDCLRMNMIRTKAFNGCTNLETLVFRSGTVATLSNINNFDGTPFASGKDGGTLYVPQALISSYQSATNWSTILSYANNQILPIEGSIYETQYADGTPIT